MSDGDGGGGGGDRPGPRVVALLALAAICIALGAVTRFALGRSLELRAGWPPEADALYLPAAPALRLASLGHTELAADLVAARQRVLRRPAGGTRRARLHGAFTDQRAGSRSILPQPVRSRRGHAGLHQKGLLHPDGHRRQPRSGARAAPVRACRRWSPPAAAPAFGPPISCAIRICPRAPSNAIVCVSVLEHIADSDGAVRGLARALIPGGTLVTGYPMVSPLMTRAFQLIAYRGIDNNHVSSPARIAAALARHLRPVARAAFPPHAPMGAALYQCTAWTR